MWVPECEAAVERLRRDIQDIEPPYLLRQYESTEEDYEGLADEDLRCEFLDGELIVHSPASAQHEERITLLNYLLTDFVSRRRLGRVFASNTVMQIGRRRFCPDLSFLAQAHIDRIRGARIVGPMDLVIEMVSSSTRRYDLYEKRDAYLDGRIPEIWMLDSGLQTCRADFLEQDTYTSQSLSEGRLHSRVLPGFSIDVAWFWSDPPPNPVDCVTIV